MWYLVLSHARPDQTERKQLHLPEHRKWLEDQHRAGRVLFSGPTSDRSVGIYVVLAASLNDAEKLAAQTPITSTASAGWKFWSRTCTGRSAWMDPRRD